MFKIWNCIVSKLFYMGSLIHLIQQLRENNSFIQTFRSLVDLDILAFLCLFSIALPFFLAKPCCVRLVMKNNHCPSLPITHTLYNCIFLVTLLGTDYIKEWGEIWQWQIKYILFLISMIVRKLSYKIVGVISRCSYL